MPTTQVVTAPAPAGGSLAPTLRPPFPIDPTAGAAFLGAAGTLSVPEGVNLIAADPEISDLVLVGMADLATPPLTIGDSAATYIAADSPLDLLSYAWPGLLILALLAGSSLLYGRRSP